MKSIKYLSAILAIVMLLSLFACNTDNSKDTTAVTTVAPTAEESKQEQTETQAPAETSEPETSETAPAETEGETEIEDTETTLVLGEEVEYAADFSVSKVFTDNMVIQRNEYVRVWGWADESENGKKVSAEFLGVKADALIENGEWEIRICERFDVNTTGSVLKIFTDKKEVSFKNVLVGDVFMVIGQSNIQYSVNEYMNNNPSPMWSYDEITEDSLIRFIYNSNTDSEGYPTRGTAEVCKDLISGNTWEIPSKTNVSRISALGYFFANEISKRTENKIPIGIIQMSASGRPLSVFMPNELAEQYGTDHFDSAQGIYIGNYHSTVVTRYMYNHYMYAYEKMPLAGIVWNQGEAESNIALSSVYVERFTALMTYMREKHNSLNKNFPVFIVEFPTTYSKPEGYKGEWPQYLDTGRIRATMGMIPDSLSNSYIAVCSDLWDDATHYNNIHPYCKYEQAERVADLAQAVMYGGKTLDEATGPILVSCEISDDRKTAVLKFTNYGEGLTTSDGGTEVKGFASIIKKNDVNSKCNIKAEITAPDTITITFSKATIGVAYNCVTGNFYGVDINLCDSYGNPAKAFWYFVVD